MIPALVLATAGGAGATVAFAAAAVVVLLVAACLRPMAQRMAAVGGIYTYTARGLGPLIAIPTGWSAIIGYACVGMAGLVAVGTYLSNIAVSAGLAGDIPTAAIIAVLIGASIIAAAIMIPAPVTVPPTVVTRAAIVPAVMCLCGGTGPQRRDGPALIVGDDHAERISRQQIVDQSVRIVVEARRENLVMVGHAHAFCQQIEQIVVDLIDPFPDLHQRLVLVGFIGFCRTPGERLQ